MGNGLHTAATLFCSPVHSKHVCEEKSILESFEIDLRAAVSNCDIVAPIQWEQCVKTLQMVFQWVVREGGM